MHTTIWSLDARLAYSSHDPSKTGTSTLPAWWAAKASTQAVIPAPHDAVTGPVRSIPLDSKSSFKSSGDFKLPGDGDSASWRMVLKGTLAELGIWPRSTPGVMKEFEAE